MKKFLKEVGLLFDSPETSSDKNIILDLFHILIWGGSFLINIFGAVMLIVFIIVFFKLGFEKSYPILFISLGSLFISYILIKIRIGIYSKNNRIFNYLRTS